MLACLRALVCLRACAVAQSVPAAAAAVYTARGYSGFFVGWQANVISDVPFAAFKMVMFEGAASPALFASRWEAAFNLVIIPHSRASPSSLACGCRRRDALGVRGPTGEATK